MSLKIKVGLAVIVILFLFPGAVEAKTEYYSFLESDAKGAQYWKKKELLFHGAFSKKEKAMIIFDNLFTDLAVSYIPSGTKVINANVSDNLLCLNVSNDIKMYGGTYYEISLRNQIIKTALDIEGIKKVTLVINGKWEALPEGSLIWEETECQKLQN